MLFYLQSLSFRFLILYFPSPIISLFDQTGIGQAFDLGQYRIIEQERFASKFCVLTRPSFAVILDVLP